MMINKTDTVAAIIYGGLSQMKVMEKSQGRALTLVSRAMG